MSCWNLAIACALAVALSSCAGDAARPPPPTSAAKVPELKPGIPAGYLGRSLPDSLALVSPPPAEGSAGFAQDQAVHAAAQALRSGPRGTLATADADLRFPHAAQTFECALGKSITPQATPRLYLLLQRSMVDAGMATYNAKNHYNRQRPFVHFSETTCTPDEEAALRKDGSYPSGHTAIGWAWALILVQVAPERADALLARGRSFGESRLVCNAHWQSDVLAGRMVASAAVARLHADDTFLADVDAVRRELQQAAPADAARCATEADQMAAIPGTL
jgi:acid phosphatase (class A)